MIVCYLILKPILQIATENNAIEKNFFMMFILFFSNWNRFNDTDTKRKNINSRCKSAKNKFFIFFWILIKMYICTKFQKRNKLR
jgi:hypothetical protein